MTTVYLIRHAQSWGNVNHVYQGRYDEDLTPKGLEQLEKLAARAEDFGLDAVYSSPSKRAYQTAEAANRPFGHKITTLESLMEIDVGEYENMPFADMVNYPEQKRYREEEPHLFTPPGGETMREVYDRMVAAVLGIARQNSGKTIAVVSHGAALRTVLCYLSGVAFERLIDVERVGNTAVTKVVFDEKLNPSIEFYGDISHLEGEAPDFGTPATVQKEELA